ncbi:SDR family NAD(P)-dependent oxidoreductase [Paenibacillus pasadenensis]|uniref:SDR family NAD(P)-dependent oxidoreductase n=1 Tax=Paenibacillus pasadenensis TaxID=217090 RepID=UPI00203EC8B7|nr:SDR family NAD(P)-dependent oxidoreductase [Paenibacillus pasadenensis]MCM3747217.1 SDR family NAD(P)-dependent oxidoreductase [Paenibacillus pasadenensis]
MKYFILTGTSRGMGQAIAEQLISPDHQLFCISRSKNPALENELVEQLEFDLRRTEEIESLMARIFQRIDGSHVEGIYLINNAAVIAPASFIDQAVTGEITDNLNINLLAPIVLTSLFIRHTNRYLIEKRILNVSSASANYHLPGLSVYSAAKAGLDVFTRCVALEQQHFSSSVAIVSVWPGMIDTGLQQEARQAAIPAAGQFREAQLSGLLKTPQETARQIIEVLLP